MADMFGAPIGFNHGEADNRQQLLGNLDALKRMGEIEAQPLERQLRSAQIREHEANAGLKEHELGAERMLAQLAQGGVAQDTPQSKLADMGTQLMAGGYAKKGMEVLKTAAELDQKAAATATQQERQRLMQIRGVAEQVKRRASFAVGALQGGTQAAYDAARLAAAEAGEKVVLSLPASYEQAKPFLQQFVAQGSDAIKQLEFAQRKIVDASTVRRNDASAGRSAMATKVLTVKERMAKLDEQEHIKNGGKNSDGAVAARAEKVQAQRERTEIMRREAQRKELAAFPPVPPADSWGDKIGKNFTWPNGAKVRIEKNPTSGKPEAVLIDMPKLLQAPGGAAAPRAGATGASNIELEDDEDVD